MGRRTRTCYLCGERYNYCPTCSQDRTKPTWMAEFHSENCKDVFDICTRWNMQLLTKEEAKESIDKCDLSNRDSFRPSVQNTLANLLQVEVKLQKGSKRRGMRAATEVLDEAIETESHEVVEQEN